MLFFDFFINQFINVIKSSTSFKLDSDKGIDKALAVIQLYHTNSFLLLN